MAFTYIGILAYQETLSSKQAIAGGYDTIKVYTTGKRGDLSTLHSHEKKERETRDLLSRINNNQLRGAHARLSSSLGSARGRLSEGIGSHLSQGEDLIVAINKNSVCRLGQAIVGLVKK